MRISDKIQAAIDAKETFFSFEYFPPRTEEVRGTRTFGRDDELKSRDRERGPSIRETIAQKGKSGDWPSIENASATPSSCLLLLLLLLLLLALARAAGRSFSRRDPEGTQLSSNDAPPEESETGKGVAFYSKRGREPP